MNDPRELLSRLAAPFAAEDLEWRLQIAYEDRMQGIAVPYVTNRAIQNRLDDVMGPDRWHNEFKPWHSTGKRESQLCGISLYLRSVAGSPNGTVPRTRISNPSRADYLTP